MFFAAIDCVQYLICSGSYSKKRIEDEGGRLAIKENFRQDQLEVGDVIFFHPRVSMLSWFIMYWTNGPWSHVAMYTGGSKIIHAISGGVVEESLYKYMDKKSFLYSLRPRGMNDEKRKDILKRAKSKLGKKYAWGKAIFLGVLILNNLAGGYRYRLSVDFVLIPFFLIIISTNSNAISIFIIILLSIHLLLVMHGIHVSKSAWADNESQILKAANKAKENGDDVSNSVQDEFNKIISKELDDKKRR